MTAVVRCSFCHKLESICEPAVIEKASIDKNGDHADRQTGFRTHAENGTESEGRPRNAQYNFDK